MGHLGGGGSQTAWGYQAYCAGQQSVGLAAGVGKDLPQHCLDWFQENNISTDGIVQHEGVATPRAWQILEADGRRHEIWRTEQSPKQASLLLPPFTSLPPNFQSARAFHLGVHPEHPPWELLEQLKEAKLESANSGILSIETFTTASRTVSAKNIERLMQMCDIFSPNEAEAQSMLYGTRTCTAIEKNHDPLELTRPFIEAGAPRVALRQGPKGALVHAADKNEAWSTPAVANTKVLDTTGCGNAFCGAFLAAIQDGRPIEAAGQYGCAAGSMMAEMRGIPSGVPLEDVYAELERRAMCIKPIKLL